MLKHFQLCQGSPDGPLWPRRGGAPLHGKDEVAGSRVDHPEDLDKLDHAPAWNSGHCLVIHVVFGQIPNRFGQG